MIKTRESLSVSQIFGGATSSAPQPLPRSVPARPSPNLQARIALVLGMIAISASLGVLVGNAMRTHSGPGQVQSDAPRNDPAS